MEKENLIKKLESINFPKIELPVHEKQLKMALMNSSYFQESISKKILKYIYKFLGLNKIKNQPISYFFDYQFGFSKQSINYSDYLNTPLFKQDGTNFKGDITI